MMADEDSICWSDDAQIGCGYWSEQWREELEMALCKSMLYKNYRAENKEKI